MRKLLTLLTLMMVALPVMAEEFIPDQRTLGYCESQATIIVDVVNVGDPVTGTFQFCHFMCPPYVTSQGTCDDYLVPIVVNYSEAWPNAVDPPGNIKAKCNWHGGIPL